MTPRRAVVTFEYEADDEAHKQFMLAVAGHIEELTEEVSDWGVVDLTVFEDWTAPT